MNISANYHAFFSPPDDRSRLTWKGRFADVPTRTDMFNFYSSGDEVLELGPQDICILTGVSDSMRRYVWHKQEAFKGRNVLYGTGWAGWGFESNVTAQAVNAAPPSVLRDLPIFEHDPDEMFSAAITTNMQNRILAKGIPALSRATGVEDQFNPSRNRSTNTQTYMMSPDQEGYWCRSGGDWESRWLHSDIQNLAFFFTHHVFDQLATKGVLR